MPQILFIHPNGREQRLDAAVGASVMQVATRHGLDEIIAECGGNAMCATCHVFVREDQLDLLPPMTDDEDALLDGTAAHRQENSRLSCQIKMSEALDGLVVTLPDRQI